MSVRNSTKVEFRLIGGDFSKKTPTMSTDAFEKKIKILNTNAELINYSKEILNSGDDFNQDCEGYPSLPLIINPVKRLIAIGDLHGDYELTINCLKLAKVIDHNNNWIGGNTHVVQVGDQIDRCRSENLDCNKDKEATIDDEHSDIKIMELMSELDKQSRKVGGRVINLFGNHEIMNSMGNLSYVSYEGIKGFAKGESHIESKNIREKESNGYDERIKAFKPGGKYAKFMACTRLSCVIIGSFLFAHAGVISELVKKFELNDRQSLNVINIIVRKWLLKEIKGEAVNDIIKSMNMSPFWVRIYGRIAPDLSADDQKCKSIIDPILKTFKIKGMAVGHTPQNYGHADGITKTCDTKLWRIDTGASKAFIPFDKYFKKSSSELRKARVLEILNDKDIKILV